MILKKLKDSKNNKFIVNISKDNAVRKYIGNILAYKNNF